MLQSPLPSTRLHLYRATAFCDPCGPNILHTHTSHLLIFLTDAGGHEGLDREAYPYVEAWGHCAEIRYGKAPVPKPASPFRSPSSPTTLSSCLGGCLVILTRAPDLPLTRPLLFSWWAAGIQHSPGPSAQSPLERCLVSRGLQGKSGFQCFLLSTIIGEEQTDWR